MKTTYCLVVPLVMCFIVGLATIFYPPNSAAAAGPWYVAPGGSDASECLSPGTACATINGAIGKAAAGDTILIAIGTYTGTGSEAVLVNKNLTLSGGWDAATFTVQAGSSTIDAPQALVGVRINSSVSAVLERFTIRGVYGIAVSGSLVAYRVTVHGSPSGGINIASGATAHINNSTITGNGNSSAYGGGISATGNLTLQSSTVTGNMAQEGGGVIASGGSVTLKNSIVYGNTAATGPDCRYTVGSAGYNLIGSTAGCSFSSATGDIVGSDPKLGLLIGTDSGLRYHPLLSGSAAIDAGNPGGCVDHLGIELTADQRGASRAGRCDIGAYEYTIPGSAASVGAVSGSGQRAAPGLAYAQTLDAAVLDAVGSPVQGVTVTFTAPASGASGTFADSGTGTTTAVTNPSGLAQSSIFAANMETGAYEVVATAEGVVPETGFDLNNAAWYVRPSGADGNDCLSPATACASINAALGKAGFALGDDILVETGTYFGSGSQVVLLDKSTDLSGGWNASFTSQVATSILDGQGARRGVTLWPGFVPVSATITRFTVQNGSQGIYMFRGNLTLNDSDVVGNKGGGNAGGILNDTGTLVINRSSVRQNSIQGSNSGGGINSSGTLIINNSAITGNEAGTSSGNGGGIVAAGTLYLNNSTVSGNTAAHGGGLFFSSGTAQLNSSTVTGNTATSTSPSGYNGGGLVQYGGTLQLRDTIVAGNINSYKPDCSGSVSSAGYNAIGNTTGCTFNSATGDLLNTDPDLGVLVGQPGYYPLMSDSPAVDAGDPGGCMGSSGLLAEDQRGAGRVGRCDIGAYEYTVPGAAASVAAFSGTPQDTVPRTAFPDPFEVLVLDSIGSPVEGAEVTFTAPASGASGTFEDSGTNVTTALTSEDGIATAAEFTANATNGTYVVAASVSGVAGTADFELGNLAWYVAPGGSDSNDCQTALTPCATINGAIGKVVAGDSILVATGTYTGSGSQVVLIDKNLTLLGGWDTDFVTQSTLSTIDGQGVRRGLQVGQFGVPGPVTGVIENLQLQNGGITIYGVLTANRIVVKSSSGSGISVYDGILYLNNSTVSGNTSSGDGGGINLSAGPGGAAYITNSTITGNTASMGGGGINIGSGSLRLNNATVAGNTASFMGGVYGPDISHRGSGTLRLKNSIVSSCAGPYGGSIVSGGYNLASGCGAPWTSTDLTYSDPMLGDLADNGGLTQTRALQRQCPSIAINAGNPAGCTDHLGDPLSTDQRGMSRVGVCDIGAYEFQEEFGCVFLPCVLRNYCAPLYRDDFSNAGSGWPVEDTGDVAYEYISGEYRILLRSNNWWAAASPDFAASDHIVEADVRNAASPYGTYGLLFGLSADWQEFYEFEIGSDGYYAIYKYDHDAWTELASGSSGAINTGTASNRLRILREGATIKAYANGTLLTTIADGSFTGLRRLGLIVFSYVDPNVDARFDNFTVYPITCIGIGGLAQGGLLPTGGMMADGTFRTLAGGPASGR